MILFKLLTAVSIRFLRWVFTIHGRYSVARERWEYGRYRSALAALSAYLFHVANVLYTARKWSAYTSQVHEQIERDTTLGRNLDNKVVSIHIINHPTPEP